MLAGNDCEVTVAFFISWTDETGMAREKKAATASEAMNEIARLHGDRGVRIEVKDDGGKMLTIHELANLSEAD
jgi:hypothetical protein